MEQRSKLPKLALFPYTAAVNDKGHLTIGGCDVVALASAYGTPLYIFDETTIRAKCSEYRRELNQRYPNSLVIYACKAFICQALIRLLQEEGLGLDVVSSGEMHVARSAGFLPQDKVYFHGNNKGVDELRLALEWGIGCIVVDNFHELALLGKLAKDGAQTLSVLLRLSPNVDPHTHSYISTGVLDSKFGFPIVTGQAEEALVKAMSTPRLDLRGLHFHLGSSIFDTQVYAEAIGIVLQFAAEMKRKHRFVLRELNVGGGFAVQYKLDTPAPSIGQYIEVITSALTEYSQKLDLDQPRLVIEPGRSIIAQAGVAIYTVGGSKDIPGIRKYIFVDGGMADNIRPALYGSKYEAMVANKATAPETDIVTIAGRFCESGDILIRDIPLPRLEAGDIVAIPASGAYSIPMSSNYNASLRPAIIMVKAGEARLIRQRETYEDLIAHDLI